MFKAPLLFILTLMISVAYARPGIMPHDQFAYLTPGQQNEMVIKVMELAVELESKYAHEVRTAGFNQQRFERYTQLMKKLSDLFMAPAYASDSAEYLSWKKHTENFISLMGKGNRCVYAGWPSIVRMATVAKEGGGTERRNICIHPKFIGGTPVPAETRAYLDVNTCGTLNQITCNPAIFGYKKASEKSAFCVKAGSKDSENSSLLCMQEALKETSDPKVDSKDKRLQFLRESMIKNRAAFEGVQQFIYKSCVCDNYASNIHQDYLAYMRPHRTCYGLMKMISDVALCVSDDQLQIDTSFFKKVSEETTLMSADPKQVDGLYNQFLGENKGTPEYQQLCGGGPSITITPEAKPDNGPQTEVPPEIKDEDAIVVTGRAPRYSCTATCPTPPAAASSEGEAAPAAKCEFVFTRTSGNEGSEETETLKETNTITTLPEKDASSFEVTAKFEDVTEEKKVNCTVEAKTEEENPNQSGLTLKVTKGATTATTQEVKAKVEGGEKGEYKITWYRQGYKGEKKPERKPETPRGLAGDSPSTDEEKPEEPRRRPEARDEDSVITEASDKEAIVETRKEESYKTCAKLTAEGKDAIPGGCVDIAKVEAKKPANAPVPGANGQPVQPMIPRGSSSTSAGGIR